MNTFPKKAAAAAALLAVLAAAAIGYVRARQSGSTQAPPLPGLLAQLPAGAPTLIYLDLAALRQSGFFRHRPASFADAAPESDYKDFVQTTGFDFEKDLDRVAIAAWPEAIPGQLHKSVAVAEGRFDQPKIRAYVQRGGRIEKQEGHEVLVFPGSKPSEWNSLTMLTDHTVMFVQGPTIAPGLGAGSTALPADPVRDRALQLAAADFFLITRMPAVPGNFSAGGIESAPVANLIRSVQWVTLAARPEGDNLRVSLEGDCASAGEARQLQSALESIRTFAQAALEKERPRTQNDKALKLWESLLETADITQSAERVRILLELPPEVLDYVEPKKTP